MYSGVLCYCIFISMLMSPGLLMKRHFPFSGVILLSREYFLMTLPPYFNYNQRDLIRLLILRKFPDCVHFQIRLMHGVDTVLGLIQKTELRLFTTALNTY